jgi:hypothetical protein
VYYHWLGIDAEMFHLGTPDHEERREEILVALGYLKPRKS